MMDNLQSARTASMAGLVHFLTLLLLSLLSFGQGPGSPDRGGPSPDFSLNVQMAGKGKAVPKTLSSYKGKWLVLDFWSKSCIACIKGFPKLQCLADSMGEKVSFVLVGKNDKKYNDGIQQMYGRIAKAEKLTLDVAFDTTSFRSFGVWATPMIAIISPEGKLLRTTTGEGLDLAMLRTLMDQSRIATTAPSQRAAPAAPLRTIVDTLSSAPHRSELKVFTGAPVVGASKLKIYPQSRRFTTLMSNLSSLYQLAYIGASSWLMSDSLYGAYWPQALLKGSDSAKFASNFETGTGYFSYRLTMDSTKADLFHAKLAMQQDLKTLFGFNVSFEIREMPVWELVSLTPRTAARLASKSASAEISGDHSGIVLRKKSMVDLLRLLQSYHQDKHIYDFSGIEGNIDIELHASLASLPSLQKALRKNGLDLMQKTRSMQVLVIADP